MSRSAREGVLQRGRLVYIRHVRRGDEKEFLALKRASRAEHEPWEPTPQPGQSWYGPKAFKRTLETTDTAERKRYFVCRHEDGAIVGTVSLSQIFRGPFNNAIMGYWVGTPYMRRGYGSEGVRLTLRHAFGPLGLHRVEANVMPTNEASLALVRSVGFRDEGYSPKYLQIAGRWADHTRWAITVEDWQTLEDRVGGRRPRRPRAPG
ncbi:MAG: GNAT family protein [Phycisphaerales bacterium]